MKSIIIKSDTSLNLELINKQLKRKFKSRNQNKNFLITINESAHTLILNFNDNLYKDICQFLNAFKGIWHFEFTENNLLEK